MDLKQAIADTPSSLTELFEALHPIYPDAELKDHEAANEPMNLCGPHQITLTIKGCWISIIRGYASGGVYELYSRDQLFDDVERFAIIEDVLAFLKTLEQE